MSLIPLWWDEFMTACYLRGLARPVSLPWKTASRTENLLRIYEPQSLELASELFLKNGIPEAAFLCADSGALRAAGNLVRSGRAISLFHQLYPSPLLKKLALMGPPAAYSIWNGADILPKKYCAILGSRSPSPRELALAQHIAQEAALRQFTVVHGGAPGIDIAAAEAALRTGGFVLEWAPCGLDIPWSFQRFSTQFGPTPARSVRLSAAAPGTAFSPSLAAERNNLLYASSNFAVVIGPRFKVGGAWHGAAHALRRRLCPIFVFGDNPAGPDALQAIGAWNAVVDFGQTEPASPTVLDCEWVLAPLLRELMGPIPVESAPDEGDRQNRTGPRCRVYRSHRTTGSARIGESKSNSGIGLRNRSPYLRLG